MSVDSTGVTRVHNSMDGSSLCELDVLRSLAEDYNIVSNRIFADALVTAGTEGIFLSACASK